MQEERRDVFQAISDPVRRKIIEHLAQHPCTVSEVANEFTISRPAISRHLKILNECDLVDIHEKGRERYCQLRPENLVPAFVWIDQYRKLWEGRLDSFEAYLNHLQAKSTNNESNESD